MSEESGAVALLKFFAAATWASVVTAYVFQGITYRLLRGVAAVRAVYVAMIVGMVVMMLVIVVTVGAMNVGLLGHYSITLK
ncbi:hypothetical protein AQS70_00545 [Pseudomonas endophytica]|uniref:Uncharacterized protein n=1 Tax=Pseudomonas endophytica TaxID=1563157 RepID=A0A0Q0XXW2_9PSED|nr:hypothetical protein AQS70_00545 [Pseudomonas endophytica]